MIILEGPDGAGKTTLLKRINRRFGIPIAERASDSIKGPVDDLCGWVDNDLLNWGRKPLHIYDRYPLISEPIYGSTIRGKLPERMTQSWMRSRLNTFRSMSLVIWCLPPFKIVADNVCGNGEQSKDARMSQHMDGVAQNIDAIWHLYSTMTHLWTGPGMTYDYSTPNPGPQDTHLVNVLRRHVNSWRTF